jgi:hypothetical protein
MANTVRVGVGVSGVGKASSDLDNFRDKFEKLKKTGAQGFAIGAGAAITAKGFSLLDTAVSSAIGVMGDAVRAAREDEESQTRLGASLQANVPNWDGNTAAIERQITARMKLGFEDEEQRRSLALLVAATHDSSKALEINRTAMDLARLKGISLEEASSALVKVEGGQFRALKSLGIVLKEGATAQDALTAVQKVATGQAEAYATTNTGKLLISQIKVGEAMEKFGRTIMPVVSDALVTAADFVEDLSNAFDGVAPTIDEVKDQLAKLEADKGWGRNQQNIDMLKDTIARLEREAHESMETLTGDGKGMTKSLGDNFDQIGDDAQRGARRVDTSLDVMAKSFKDTRDEITDTVQGFADAVYDPLIAAADLAATRREIAEQKTIIASKTSTKAQIADAKLRLLELRKDETVQLGILFSYGDKTSAATLKHQIEVLKGTKHLSKEQIVQLKLLEAEFAKLEKAAKDAAAAISRATPETGHVTPGSGRAAGGPVAAGKTYTVGEAGEPETLVMFAGGGGHVFPGARRGASTGVKSGSGGVSSGGGDIHIHVYGVASMTPGSAEALARQIEPHITRAQRRSRAA